MRPRPLLFGLFALAGCSTHPLLFVESPSADDIRSELAAFHRKSGLSLYAFSRDEPFAIREETEPALLVETLLYTESLEELGLSAGPLMPALGRSRGIPPPALIFERTIDGAEAGAWRARANMSDEVANVRIAGTCGLLDPNLEPFAAEAIAIRPEDDDDDPEVRFRRVELIDENSVFALTNHALYLIRRGERWVAAPGQHFNPGYTLRSFDFDRGRSRVWVVGETVLTELSFDGSMLVETSSVTGCFPPHVFEEVVVDELGRPVVATDRGGTCRLEQGAFRDLAVMQLLFGLGANVLSLVTTPDPAHPFLGSSTSRLHLYDSAQNTWVIGDGTNNLSPPFLPYALASRSVGGGTESWAGGTEGRIFQQVDAGTWTPWPISYPPDHIACGAGEYPNITDTDSIRAIHLLEDRVLLVMEFCGAIVELDRSGRCSMLATPGGLDAEDGSTLDSIDVFGSTVIAGGTSGLLYSGRIR